MKEQDLVAAVRETAGTDTVEHTKQAVRATLPCWGSGSPVGNRAISPASCHPRWPG